MQVDTIVRVLHSLWFTGISSVLEGSFSDIISCLALLTGVGANLKSKDDFVYRVMHVIVCSLAIVILFLWIVCPLSVNDSLPFSGLCHCMLLLTPVVRIIDVSVQST